MSATRPARPVLIAHAEGDEEVAERLAGPIRAAGYEVVHRGTVLVGESLMQEATRVLTAGGPVVLCGTIRAMGTLWAQQVVSAARAYSGVRVFGVQVERDANLRYLTFDAEVAAFWLDPDRAAREVVAALAKYYPVEEPTMPSPALSEGAAEQRFRDLLLGACDIVDLANLPADRQLATRELMLRNLYVPLKVRVEREAGQDVDAEELIALERRRRATVGTDMAPVQAPSTLRGPSSLAPVGQRLQQSRRLVILGDPGAGKTTMLRWMATGYLLRLRRDPDWSALPAVDTLPDEDWLPVLVRCRDLGPEQLAGTLEDMVVHVLRRSELPAAEVEVLKEVVSQRLDRGTALLLIDGLDEITDPGARARFCRQLEQVHLARPNAPIIATSRIVGYREMGYRIGRGFEHLTIADLDRSDKDDFIRRWCAVTEPPGRQQTTSAQLVKDIHSTDRIERLTSNPMLLTTMALVKRKVGKLPDHRAELYREAVQVLLNWRAEVDEPIDPYEALPQLEYIAYAMSDRGVQQVTDDDIVALLDQMRVEYPTVHPIHRRPATELIRLLERRTGILVESGFVRQAGRLAPVFEFRHLTFQEYLAALALVDGRFPGRDRGNSLAENVGPLAGRLGDSADGGEPAVVDSWRETIRLCVTMCNDDDVDGVLTAVLTPDAGEDPANTARPRAVLAAECLADEPNTSDTTVEEILRRLVAYLPSDDDRSNTLTAVVGLARSRWASHLLRRLVRELRERGERAISSLGRLCGEAVVTSGPTTDGELTAWLSTQIAAFDGAYDNDALRAVLAVGYAASQGRRARWPDTVWPLLGLITVDDPVLAAAAAWALAQVREISGPAAWYPSDQEVDRIRAAMDQPNLDAARAVSLATACGPGRVDTIEPLLAAASDGDPRTRAAAVRVLGQAAREDAVAPLVARLDDAEPKVRGRAAAALGELGSSRGVTALLMRLDDPDAAVRAEVVQALGQLGDLRPVEPLLAALDDPNTDVRGRAALTLGLLGDGRAVRPLLVRFADLDLDPEAEDAWLVTYALGLLGDGRAVEALLARLCDGPDDLDWWMAVALGNLGDRRTFETFLARLGGASLTVRRWLVWALGRLGDTRALGPVTAVLGDDDMREQAVDALAEFEDARVLEPLVTALGDPNAGVRRRAAEALGQLADARALAPLVIAVHDTDAGVRSSAAQALGRLDDARALAHLLDALRDACPEVRGRAAEALGELNELGAVEALATALTDPVAYIREQAADALGELDDRRCLPALRRRLTDPDPTVRANALGALGQLGDLRSFTTIVRHLDVADTTERMRAAYALGQLGDGRAVPPLLAILGDPHPQVREWAARALGRLDANLVIEPLLARLDDPHAEVSRQISRALGALGDLRAASPLLARLDNPHPRVRAAAAAALGDLGAGVAVDALLTCLDDSHPRVRADAAWALGELGDAHAIAPLLPRLDDPHPSVCCGAIWALGQLGDAREAPHVVELFDSPYGAVRGRAVEALAKLEAGNAAPWLVRGLADPNPKVRERAAWGLARCPGEVAAEPLLTGLDDPHPDVRSEVVGALGRLGYQPALDPLLARLADPATSVRGKAARALGRLGNPAAGEALRRAVDDTDPWVRSRAVWALDQLGGTRSTQALSTQALRPLLASTCGISRRTAVAVLSGIGDQYARRILRNGLTADAACTRRDWVEAFARTLSDGLDDDLLSRDGEGLRPYLDSRAAIDNRRIQQMARLLRLDPAEVRRRYARLAKTVPLRLT